MDNAPCTHIFAGMEFDTDIVIAGGGLNGLSMALALRSAGFAVTVIVAAAYRSVGMADEVWAHLFGNAVQAALDHDLLGALR